MLVYKDFTIDKTGRSFQDYHIKLGDKHKWGTLEEIKKDIDNYIDNLINTLYNHH